MKKVRHPEKNSKPVDHVIRTHFLTCIEGSAYHISQETQHSVDNQGRKKKNKNKLQCGYRE